MWCKFDSTMHKFSFLVRLVMFEPISVLKYHRKPFPEGSFLVMIQKELQNNCLAFFKKCLLGLEFSLPHSWFKLSDLLFLVYMRSHNQLNSGYLKTFVSVMSSYLLLLYHLYFQDCLYIAFLFLPHSQFHIYCLVVQPPL